MMAVSTPPPLNRAERRKQHTREAIKRAALELLLHDGYAALSVQAITARADIGYGTFYLHFEDKDDAIWAAMVDNSERLQVEIDAQLADMPYPRREFMSWVLFFDYMHQTRAVFIDVFGSHGSAKLQHNFFRYTAELHERHLKAATYSAGLDLPPEFLAQFIAGALVRLLMWWLENPSAYTSRQMAEMMFIAVFRQPPPL
ncbi:MAG: TetR/AcrR family transcriptional regulator [Anaerolineae bacterium]|nr:TetR/AcrR family transcriptional regulator [Anaerolineae bacterium]